MKYKKLVILLIIIAGAFFFYWFQWRPTQIKHDCSWAKRHSNAIVYRSAMTKSELENKGVIRTCKNEFDLVKKIAPNYDINSGDDVIFSDNYTLAQKRVIWDATSCRSDGDRVIVSYKNPIKAIPARDWYEKATKDEYSFCLHDKGL